MNRAVVFTYSGRFGHFLKAEANASAPSYAVPPRTALLGLAGAVLGLGKDEPQVVLAEARLAVCGHAQCTHWHTANLRKDPPTSLPWTVRQNSKGSSSAQRNTIIAQEWLIQPSFKVWAMLPDAYQSEFAERIRNRRWHFSPCLGLSEMQANLEFVAEVQAALLPMDEHQVLGIVRRGECELDLQQACLNKLAIQTLRMPRDVTPGRAFSHEAYYREITGSPIPVRTDKAWQAGSDKLMWL
jgi:CRISPR-associated protein Cas5h